MMGSPIPLTVPRALMLLGVQKKFEDRQALAQLWSLYPGVETLEELKKELAATLTLKEGFDTIQNGALSAEQVRAKLQALGLL